MCTVNVVSTDTRHSESFEVYVGLHQGLNPLLFTFVMDVVFIEARSVLPAELLYADEFDHLAPTMHLFGRRVAELFRY